MSVQIASGPNFNKPNMNSKQLDNKLSNGSAFKIYDEEKKAPAKVKSGVFLTTLAGVAAAMAITLKGKGYKFSEFFKGLTHVTYDSKKAEVEKLVGMLSVGSVGGGLIGGALFDKKENMNAKYREAIIQIVGNIATPLACVAGGLRVFKRFEPKIIQSMKLTGKMEKIPNLIVSAGCLVAGIFLGNKVGNIINEKAFHIKDNRKIKLSDMSPHIDDACLAISLVAADSSVGPVVSRFIPAALMVAGISTGIAQEKPERCKRG